LGGTRGKRGFTVIELLVAISIISLLSAVLVPSVSKVRRQAKRILSANNQKHTAAAVTMFALDNDDYYPESVATIGTSWSWNWQEPMMMTGYRARSPRMHRSMSDYLRGYIDNVDTLYCPSAPKKYRYLQDSWDAGDEWDNPETGPVRDPVSGTYCFFWSYTGCLAEYGSLFTGPTRSGQARQSSLLMTDYFGYNHHRSRNAFGSCEKFDNTDITMGTVLSSAYWSRTRLPEETPDMVNVTLNAAYTDGHIESYTPADAAVLKVIWKVDTNEPYPEGIGPGDFFIPRTGIR
jgi:prepilin-type N-terminal cleavage/methylation domain-containing protein